MQEPAKWFIVNMDTINELSVILSPEIENFIKSFHAHKTAKGYTVYWGAFKFIKEDGDKNYTQYFEQEERLLINFGNYLFHRYGVQVHSNDGTNTPLYERLVTDADIANFFHEEGIERPKKIKLPSRFQNGDDVQVNYGTSGMIRNCKVIKVHFSDSKVLYDVEMVMAYINTKSENCFSKSRLYNIDSVFVEPAE